MSDFKFACPVCGQHVKVDSSQAGTQMQCPTCFQKVTVPQAPATEEQRWILKGTVKGDRPKAEIAPGTAGPPQKIPHGITPVAYYLLWSLVFAIAIGGAAVFLPVFSSHHTSPQAMPTNAVPVKAAPVVMAPRANDTNWMLDLSGATVPDSPAAGRIHGHDFILGRAILEDGTLTLREGQEGPLILAIRINFGGVRPEALAGQSVNIATNAPMAARIVLIWPEGDEVDRARLEGGYAMRLDFGKVHDRHISGKLYFCAPDNAKSYIDGSFNAQIYKPRRHHG